LQFWLATLIAGLHAYGTIFVSMVIVAFLMPEEPALLAWGLAVGAWQLRPELAWLAAIAGVLSADVALYGLGRFGGRRLLLVWGLKSWFADPRRRAIERSFRQAGAVWLILARLLPIPGLRTGVFVSAGMLRYPWWRFLACDATFLALAGGALVLGGYYYAEAMRRWLQGFDTLRYWLALLAALMVGGLGLWYVSEWLGQKISRVVDNGSRHGLPARVADGSHSPANSETTLPVPPCSDRANSQKSETGPYLPGTFSATDTRTSPATAREHRRNPT